MTSLVPAILFGWIILVQVFFVLLPARRAVIAVFIASWLFLPQAGIMIPGLPDLTKISATSCGVMLGITLFDFGRLISFRPHWIDAPMVVWCLAPIGSALTNAELTPYDGVSAALDTVITWGVPYFAGRLYFDSLVALRDLAAGIVIGGLIYVPLCLFEMRFSPQLHRILYGYHPHQFFMTIRFGGYRPVVFMQHGLMVAMWMGAAALMAGWLWCTGAMVHIRRVPMSAVAAALVVVTVLCKSVGAVVLLAGGFAFLLTNRFTRSAALVVLVLAAPVGYMALRGSGVWSGEQLVSMVEQVMPDKAGSLEVRVTNETRIAEHALSRPLFGWGRWGRWRVTAEESGDDITRSDGMWVIALGQTGVVGLAAFAMLLLLPAALLTQRIHPKWWSHSAAAPAGALAALLLIYALDCLLNAMINPVFILAAGALSGYFVLAPRTAAVADEPMLPEPFFDGRAARAGAE